MKIKVGDGRIRINIRQNGYENGTKMEQSQERLALVLVVLDFQVVLPGGWLVFFNANSLC